MKRTTGSSDWSPPPADNSHLEQLGSHPVRTTVDTRTERCDEDMFVTACRANLPM